MARIDSLTEQRIKDAANIVDVAQDFIALKRKGSDYVGYCPFHNDRHIGSFVVSESKNVCSCFSCGIHYGPVDFLMNYDKGMKYGDALRYLASKYGIFIEGEKPMEIPKAQPRQPLPELPTLILPAKMVTDKRPQEGNTLIEWLRSLPWTDELREMLDKWLNLYLVGTSTTGDTKGWTIWWYIDDKMGVRTGKLMKYKTDGHRDHDGYNFNFVHSMLKKAGYWSDEDMEMEMRMCLFGLHLIDVFPEAEIAIVESEKSAIIAQTFSTPGKKLFMATGSKGTLTRKMLQPLIDRGRSIVLYPDVDGMAEWRERAKAIGYERISVTQQVERLYDPCYDSPKSDIADILLRLMQPIPEENTVQKAHRLLGLEQENEALTTLINKLGLEIK